MSSTPAPQPTPWVTFTLPKRPTEGTIMTNETQPAYTLQKGKRKGLTSPTVLCRANGQLVAEFVGPGLSHGRQITVDGVEHKTLLHARKSKWYKSSNPAFYDDFGNEYVWKELVCYAVGEDMMVAKFKRKKDRLFKPNEPAELTVNPSYMHMVDMILCTRLELEAKERRNESISKAADSVDIASNIISMI